MEKRIQVTLRLPVDLWKAISKKAIDEETNLQAVGLKLYQHWAGEPPKGAGKKDK